MFRRAEFVGEWREATETNIEHYPQSPYVNCFGILTMPRVLQNFRSNVCNGLASVGSSGTVGGLTARGSTPTSTLAIRQPTAWGCSARDLQCSGERILSDDFREAKIGKLDG